MKCFLNLKNILTSVLLLLSAGCVSRSTKSSSEQPPWLGASFDLSRKERIELSKKAQSGDAKAAYRLHEFYSIARYDRKKSMYWLGLSAELGFTPAQYNYGFSLRESKSAEDNRQAVKWFRIAAEKGHRTAERALAEALEAGKGTTTDLVAARSWYDKAARAGDSTAAEKLAEFLSEGKGGPSDAAMAYAWSSLLYSRYKGSVFGDSILTKKDKLREKLDAQELERGEKEFAILQNTIPPESEKR